MYGCEIDARAVSMFDPQSRSGPTEIGWMKFERTWSRLTIRYTGNGQSLQCFRKKKTKGRQASKNASQLETTMATELANAFSSGIRNSCDSRMRRARDFFCENLAALLATVVGFGYHLASEKIRGRTGFDS